MELKMPATESGYSSNKDVKFKKIDSIFIENFRTLKNRTILLGDNITLITGKNGTMKSSILGLLAHPFSSPNKAKDIFGKDLKTSMNQVFRMSLEKDKEKYQYYLNATSDTGIQFSEPIRMYISAKDRRHRVTVGKDNQSNLGNFNLNTSYINLKRLFPIIETTASVITNYAFTRNERKWISDAYQDIMTRDAFTEFDCISDYKEKNTLGPKNASYDFNSISSGEDNLGNILMKMLAFEKNKNCDGCLQGIFCIDEIEASLHPVALTNLFEFLMNWSEKNKIQIVATTHSLYLIDYALKYQNRNKVYKEKICLNIISTAQVGDDQNYRILNNPTYKDAYKELTLKNPEDFPLYKVNILCEDDIAVTLIKRIIKSSKITSNIDFISNVSGSTGTPSTGLIALGKNGPKLLEDSIIILDPDVNPADIKHVQDRNVDVLIIPDQLNQSNPKQAGLAIEKMIIKFVCNLDGANPIFANEEKIAILNSFHHFSIYENQITPSDNIQKYKNWQENNKTKFNSFLTIYVKENPNLFDAFKENLLNMLNEKRSLKGLPLLSY